MTQDVPQHVKLSTIGQEYAEHEADSLGSNRVPRKDGEMFSLPLISTMTRPFAPRSDGKCSYISSTASSRLLRFLIVGGIGVIVNLVVMALVFETAGYRDWRASAIASTVAALHNYLLNNHWTFADHRRSGRALFSGAFLYLPMSAVGVAITTVTYSILAQARFRAIFGTSPVYLFGVQLVSISLGTYLNYSLNKFFTWRSGDDSDKPRHELHPGKVMLGVLASSDDLHD